MCWCWLVSLNDGLNLFGFLLPLADMLADFDPIIFFVNFLLFIYSLLVVNGKWLFGLKEFLKEL